MLGPNLSLDTLIEFISIKNVCIPGKFGRASKKYGRVVPKNIFSKNTPSLSPQNKNTFPKV